MRCIFMCSYDYDCYYYYYVHVFVHGIYLAQVRKSIKWVLASLQLRRAVMLKDASNANNATLTTAM